MLKQNEELQKQNRELLAIIDSLKKEIQSQVQPKPNPSRPASRQATAEKQEEVSPGMKISEPIDPRKLARAILKRYEDLNAVKEKSSSTAIKRVREIRDDIGLKLDELGNHTMNTKRTESIKKSLPSDKDIEKSIGEDKKAGRFFPNDYLKKTFNKSMRKVQELESTLK